MRIVQDTLTAACKMSRRDVFIEHEHMMQLVMILPRWQGIMPLPAIMKPKPLWTNKQLFSLILPPLVILNPQSPVIKPPINYVRTHSTRPDNEDDFEYILISPGDTNVIVDNSQLIAGILCKKTLGTTAVSLAHLIFMERGNAEAASLFTTSQLVLNNWLLIESFSIGASECDVTIPLADTI